MGIVLLVRLNKEIKDIMLETADEHLTLSLSIFWNLCDILIRGEKIVDTLINKKKNQTETYPSPTD